MDWHLSLAQSLAQIDAEQGEFHGKPAEYEIIRRVILVTGDREYQELISLSERALAIGAAALASRTPIIVDSAIVQTGIKPYLSQSFINPVYSGLGDNQSKEISKFTQLIRENPDSIMIVGQEINAINIVLDLINNQKIKPALIIATPPTFDPQSNWRENLNNSGIPHIAIINSSKGGTIVAMAIMNGLIDLAWKAYSQQSDDH